MSFPVALDGTDLIQGKLVQRIRWIASYPKSGNTLIRFFLSAYMNDGVVDINSPHGCMFHDTQYWHYQACSAMPVNELGTWARLFLRPAALLHMVASAPEPYPIFCKTHFTNGRMAGIETIPPLLTENAIYLVRDPRDIAVSMADHFDPVSESRTPEEHLDDVVEIICNERHRIKMKGASEVLSHWSKHVESWTSEHVVEQLNVLVIRYEDLIKDPKKWLKKILEHHGFPIEDEVVDRSVESCSLQSLRKQEEAHPDGFREIAGERSFFSRGKAGNWQGVLGAEHVNRIETTHAEMMEKFGYAGGRQASAAA